MRRNCVWELVDTKHVFAGFQSILKVNMKVVYEGILWQSRQIDDFVVVETSDTQTGTADKIVSKFKGKRVKITIEEIPDPKVPIISAMPQMVAVWNFIIRR